MPDWSAEQLRISLFSSGPAPLSEKDWQVITGQAEAETRSAIVGGKVYSGKFINGQFSLAHSGNRIDAILSSRTDVNFDPTRLIEIDDWKHALPSFVAPLQKWLAEMTFPIVRVAFGGALNSEAATRDEAYERLAGLLHSVKVKPAMKELMFRCNWTRKSMVKELLLLNRVTVWSVISVGRSLLQLTGDQVAMSKSAAHELQAVRLEFDINTDGANTTPFEQSELVPILEELIGLAQRNAKIGEEQ